MGEGDKNFLTPRFGEGLGMRALGCTEHQVVFLPSPLGRRAGDEGLASGIYFVICAASAASGIQRQKEYKVATPVSPHSNPLPMGEGDKDSLREYGTSLTIG
jgi:hypothetical protein